MEHAHIPAWLMPKYVFQILVFAFPSHVRIIHNNSFSPSPCMKMGVDSGGCPFHI